MENIHSLLSWSRLGSGHWPGTSTFSQMSFKNVSPFASVLAAAPSHCVVDQTDVADEIEAAKRALEDDIAFDDDFEATEATRDDADIDERSPALNASISFSSHASLTRNRDAIAGFDETKGDTWIYPTNLPLRDYQFNIAQKALYNNTLVCLPTGLGKTFIAAVLMYNFYRWYPGGRIVFMAPTKPLVAQQIEACFKVMGIPQSDMSEMTGTREMNKKLTLFEYFASRSHGTSETGVGVA